MKFWFGKKATLVAVTAALMSLGACSTDKVIDNTVDLTAGATKLAVHGVVGVGKLAVRGTGAAIDAVSGGE